MAMLRVMNDSTFVCGADGNLINLLNCMNWIAFATELRNTVLLKVLVSQIHFSEINGLPIIKFGRNQKNT
jgi:DEAD/DEAH box helicase domain-containing protein